MTSVLLIGLKPETVDFSDPDLPPGMNAEKIAAAIQTALKAMADKGWSADFCGISPDESADGAIRSRLEAKPYDCVVIGGGVRMPRKLLTLFERCVNTVHKAAPNAAIAFNTSPENTPEAAGRWIS